MSFDREYRYRVPLSLFVSTSFKMWCCKDKIFQIRGSQSTKHHIDWRSFTVSLLFPLKREMGYNCAAIIYKVEQSGNRVLVGAHPSLLRGYNSGPSQHFHPTHCSNIGNSCLDKLRTKLINFMCYIQVFFSFMNLIYRHQLHIHCIEWF